MADDNKAQIVLSAADKTKAAFDAVKQSFKTLADKAEGANTSFATLGAVLGSAFSVGASPSSSRALPRAWRS
jgi:hypothetical protein